MRKGQEKKEMNKGIVMHVYMLKRCFNILYIFGVNLENEKSQKIVLKRLNLLDY